MSAYLSAGVVGEAQVWFSLMFSVSSANRTAVAPSPLSHQTTVIIIVCASIAGLVLLVSLGRALLSRFSSSTP